MHDGHVQHECDIAAAVSCSEHPGVAKISFTGSTATGQKIAMAAAKNGKGTCMELGGKSAMIVFEDANIEHAVEWAMVRMHAIVLFCYW